MGPACDGRVDQERFAVEALVFAGENRFEARRAFIGVPDEERGERRAGAGRVFGSGG